MRKAAAFFAAIFGLAILSGASAQTVAPTLVPQPTGSPAPAVGDARAVPTQPNGAQPLTAEDVNAWLDGFIPISIRRADIPGAVVVVVKDGQVLTERGYGY